MLIPLHNAVWVNTSRIVRVIQKDKNVYVYLTDGHVEELTDALVDEVAKYLNTQLS